MMESVIGERTGKAVRVPVLGRVVSPPPEKVVYYAGLGLLAVFGVVEWPVALVVGIGHTLADQQHWKMARGLGKAIEEA